MFSSTTWKYFREGRGFGRLEESDREAISGSRREGIFFGVQLKLSEGQIQKLGFLCPRCIAAIACGGYLNERLLGKPLSAASDITVEEVLRGLGGLPSTHSYYAWMAVKALGECLAPTTTDPE